MAPKYTIFKALIHNSTKGFTLLELLIGLTIMVIIGSAAMNGLIQASGTFNNDKKNIQSAQSLSAVLEIIGNDIRQSGEKIIGDSSFPVIEIRQDSFILPDGISTSGSTIIIRRALTTPMTLCEQIPASDTATRLKITVADTTSPNTNCNPVSINTLAEVQNYRCQLGDPNVDYSTSNNYCATALASAQNDPLAQKVTAVISNQAGQIRKLTYTGEDTTAAPNQYKMIIDPSFLLATDPNNVAYNVGSPIYLIEERRYTLDTNGNLKVSIDGGNSYSTLVSGITQFKVSARSYKTDATTTPQISLDQRIIDPNGAFTNISGTTAAPVTTALANAPCVTADVVPINNGGAPAGTSADPTYACRINSGNNVANWKQIAGVRVELQAKYDPAGQSATPTQASLDKSVARAEYFPRNVLSK